VKPRILVVEMLEMEPEVYSSGSPSKVLWQSMRLAVLRGFKSSHMAFRFRLDAEWIVAAAARWCH
jgi:hypothetical protein